MKIVVASGKGGVGKSMLTSSLAILLDRKFRKNKRKQKIVVCDCDVDAPNLGLWLGETRYDTRKKISTSVRAYIDQNRCIRCGKCKSVCRFNAVDEKNIKSKRFIINQFLCEGCGACQIVCPSNAIKLKRIRNGEIRIRKTKYGFMLVSGQVYPGEAGSGKIVEQLKAKTEEFKYDIMLLDAPAGIGCPVIAAVRGCDFAVLVTEPTPSGFSDLRRILEVVTYFKIPFGIVINKWDINPELSKEMKKFANKDEKHFLGKISYDKAVIDSIVNLKPVILSDSKSNSNISDSKTSEEIKEIYENLYKRIKKI